MSHPTLHIHIFTRSIIQFNDVMHSSGFWAQNWWVDERGGFSIAANEWKCISTAVSRMYSNWECVSLHNDERYTIESCVKCREPMLVFRVSRIQSEATLFFLFRSYFLLYKTHIFVVLPIYSWRLSDVHTRVRLCVWRVSTAFPKPAYVFQFLGWHFIAFNLTIYNIYYMAACDVSILSENVIGSSHWKIEKQILAKISIPLRSQNEVLHWYQVFLIMHIWFYSKLITEHKHVLIHHHLSFERE